MLNLIDENFEKEIQGANKPVLVDFWAGYCPSCLILTPILEKLTKEFSDKLIFIRVDLETAPLVAQKYKIDKIPTIILFKNGKPVGAFSGVRPESIIRELLNKMLKESENNNTAKNEVHNTLSEKEKIMALIKGYEEYAQKNRYKLNSNREVVERMAKGLFENKKKYGAEHCPCRRVTENPEENSKIVCPCAYHQQEIEKNGQCLCGLFIK